MEKIGTITGKKFKGKQKPKKNPHLHSPSHLLADELSKKLNDTKHFAFYLKMATLYDHNFLRKLAEEVLESDKAHTPGRLFAYLIKKTNQEKKARGLSSSPGAGESGSAALS